MLDNRDIEEARKGQAMLDLLRAQKGIQPMFAVPVNPSPQTPKLSPSEQPYSEDKPPEVMSSLPAVPVEDTDRETPKVKIWPLVGLAAIRNQHGGAWRVWVLARSVDPRGSGKVSRAALRELLTAVGVDPRRRRRWVHDAIHLGLLSEHKSGYYLAGAVRCARLLGCHRVGRPAAISAFDLVRSGWRSAVWSAYLATLHGRPVSQATKQTITGVDPRTQRNYQHDAGAARRNYARTNHKGDHVSGLRDNGRPGAFVGIDGRVFYRLPDIRTVPGDVAQIMPKGRSRKVQKQINSSSEGRGKGLFLKLFHDTSKGVKSALRQVSKADLPPWELPGEVFELLQAGRTVNIWRPVAVCEVQP